MPSSENIVSRDSKDSLLTEIREAFDYDLTEWKDIRDEGKKDMKYVSGDPWDEKDRAKRENAGRPCLSVDELNQYFNQVINGVRANPRAVKFAPNGNGANDKTAEFYADKMREIEYRSKAQIAYTTAFENAVQRGYGFCRVTSKHCTTPGERFNQDIWIESIPNPDLVLPDADAQRPDSSDMLRCTVYESWTKKQFLREFGERATVKNFTSDHAKDAPKWIQADSLLLAEHWKVKTKRRKLLLVQPAPASGTGSIFGLGSGKPARPIDVWEDEYLKDRQLGDTILKAEERDDRSVCQYLTNGIEILEEKPWPGQYIPIISCYGKVLYVDSGAGAKRIILSMTRLARDPFMLYCYYRTTQAELVGMTPKTPYMAYQGQLDKTQLEAIAKSLHEPVPVILANATTEGTGQAVLPLPQRQPYVPAIDLMEIGAEGARRAIQSAMATNFMPTQAQRRNEKSGAALDKIDEVAQRGSFHFNDHYDDMQTHVGVVVEDVMDKYYDTERSVGIRKADDKAEVIQINSPGAVSTKGSHQVTVSTGPDFNSTREAAEDLANTLISNPMFAEILGPQKAAELIALGIRLKNVGPLGDQMAEVISPKQDGEQKINPQQVKQMFGQMQAENDNLKKILTQLSLELKTKKLDLDTKVRIAAMEIASKEKIAIGTSATAVKVAEIKAGIDEDIAVLEAKIAEAQAMIAARQSQLDRQHEVGVLAQEHEHAQQQAAQAHQQQLAAGQVAHQQNLEAGDVGHQQTLEQTEVEASLAPEPAEPTE